MNADASIQVETNLRFLQNISCVYAFVQDRAIYQTLCDKCEPRFVDNDPITSDEEGDLNISMNDFINENTTFVPKSCSDENFLKMLKS